MNKFKLVWGLLWKPVLQVALVSLTIWLIPVKSIPSVILSVLVWVLVFELVFNSPVAPRLREWVSLILRTSILVALPLVVYSWLGAYGLLGAILILLAWVGYILIVNWKLYDYTTTWGAQRLFKGSKEEFNLEKVKQ